MVTLASESANVVKPDFPTEAFRLSQASSMFHATNPTLFGRPEGVLSETEALQSTLVQLRSVAAALTARAPRAPLVARRLLATFAANLRMYFALEDATRYFGAMESHYPFLGPQVAATARTRKRLRDSVTALRRLARLNPDLPDLGPRIITVVKAFERQEQAENELLQEYFLRDEGSGESG